MFYFYPFDTKDYLVILFKNFTETQILSKLYLTCPILHRPNPCISFCNISQIAITPLSTDAENSFKIQNTRCFLFGFVA